MGKSVPSHSIPGLPPSVGQTRFVSAVTTAIVALITVGMRNVGMRYFEGNVLGFIGLCTVIVMALRHLLQAPSGSLSVLGRR